MVKPTLCPFCGSDSVEPTPCSTEGDGSRQYWTVECGKCEARGPRIDVTAMRSIGGERPWDDEAIRRWNERAISGPVRAIKGDLVSVAWPSKPPPAVEYFNPWELPECGPEYEVMLMDGTRSRGAFHDHGNPSFGRIHGIWFRGAHGDPVMLRHVRVWRRVEP